MILGYLQFVPILVSVLIVFGTFYIQKRDTVKRVLVVNFIALVIVYAGIFYVNHLDYTYEAWYEVKNEVLTEFFLNRVYNLYYHIFGVLTFAGVNLLVLFKYYSKLEIPKT